MEVVPEENAIGRDYFVKPLLFVFKLVDVGKDDGAVYRHFDLVIGFRVFRNEVSVPADLVHEVSKIVPGLAEGIFPNLLSAAYEKLKLLGISGEDLVERPVLDLEDDEAGVLGVKDEIRFLPLDVRLVPGRIRLVGLGAGLEKPVKSSFPRRGEGLDVRRYHCGHVIKNETLLPCPDHADPSGIIRVGRLKESQGTTDLALLNVRRETGVAGFDTTAPGHLVAQGAVSVKEETGCQANCITTKMHKAAITNQRKDRFIPMVSKKGGKRGACYMGVEQKIKEGHDSSRNPLYLLVGDPGFEPGAFGSGGQRSIHLS